MPENAATDERIDSWKDISAYLGRDVSTVLRWEKERGLPIHRIPGGKRQGVFAYRHEIDEWLKSGAEVHRESAEKISLEPEQRMAVEISTEAQPVAQIRSTIFAHPARQIVVAFALLGIAIFSLQSLTGAKRVQFSGISQLTDDGTLKMGLVTDGANIYFDEIRDGKTVLASIPVAGGQTTTISTFLTSAMPTSISPDGSNILVLNRDGREERSLWIVPVSEKAPRRAGSIRCHWASWSPSGIQIAFASGNGIYMTQDEGVTTRLVHQFAAVPERVQWSPDGTHLQFQLRDEHSGLFSLRELFIGEEDGQMTSLNPLNVNFSQYGAYLAIFDNDGQAFISTDHSRSGKLWFLERQVGLRGIAFHSLETGASLPTMGMLAIDKRSRKLFALCGISPSADFLHYDQDSRKATPFLPGLSASDLDFSRDGQWLTYVSLLDRSLWRSRIDGGDAQKLTSPGAEIELPRWSPDGKQIAFMAKFADKPWRIYLVSPMGGQAREASTGTYNQGAPTWSPDGKRLIYGNVKCQEMGTCGIHEIQLATGRVTLVPSSEGLATARLSPDGRYIGALQPERHQAYLFDYVTQRWRRLADDVSGDDLAWSKDSRFLYASKPTGNRLEIIRVPVQNGRVDSAVDLSSLSKLKGNIDTWFGIAPDGAIILKRSLNSTEIFALNYAFR